MSEINPNHPTLRTLHDHWHKICAALVRKFGGDDREVVLSLSDVDALARDGDAYIVVQELHDGLHLRLVDAKTAHAAAKKEGGLPT